MKQKKRADYHSRETVNEDYRVTQWSHELTLLVAYVVSDQIDGVH